MFSVDCVDVGMIIRGGGSVFFGVKIDRVNVGVALD